MSRTYRWRCVHCKQEFQTWTSAERHADAEGHHRLEVLIVTTPDGRR